MKEDNKIKKNRERQVYVPAKLKVIEFTAQRVICISGENENYKHQNPNPNWF